MHVSNKYTHLKIVNKDTNKIKIQNKISNIFIGIHFYKILLILAYFGL